MTCRIMFSLLTFFSLELKHSEDEKALLQVKCNQFGDHISSDMIKIRDLEGKIKVLNGEQASMIASKTSLQQILQELQVKNGKLIIENNKLCYCIYQC